MFDNPSGDGAFAGARRPHDDGAQQRPHHHAAAAGRGRARDGQGTSKGRAGDGRQRRAAFPASAASAALRRSGEGGGEGRERRGSTGGWWRGTERNERTAVEDRGKRRGWSSRGGVGGGGRQNKQTTKWQLFWLSIRGRKERSFYVKAAEAVGVEPNNQTRKQIALWKIKHQRASALTGPDLPPQATLPRSPLRPPAIPTLGPALWSRFPSLSWDT